MNILKIVTILNWIIIGSLAVLVIAETVRPDKGGDAYGRAMGQVFFYIAIIILFVMLGLNLLPYKWAKYTALAVIFVPFFLMKLGSVLSSIKQKVSAKIESSKPVFDDKERESIARAVYDGNPEAVKKILQKPVPRLNENGELLSFVVNHTASSDHKIEERLECIRLLLQAGARLEYTRDPGDYPLHMFVASTGNAKLLRFLLEQGADANATYDNRHTLFEAVGSYQKPDLTVRVLLEFGADLNTTAILNDEQGPVTPLFLAAILERWGVCATLLEKGANPDVKAADGTSFHTLFQEAEKNFSPNGYSTREDFERLKKMLL
ncbi:MAG: ankyrin repeat domain-containing protein [Saprospiraceae bacterium]